MTFTARLNDGVDVRDQQVESFSAVRKGMRNNMAGNRCDGVEVWSQEL